MKFGLVGLGRFGKNYQRLLGEMTGVDLIAVSSHRDDAVSVILNPEIEAVIIATPPKSHFGLAKQTLVAGKHVLVEKPMTASLGEARDLEIVVKNSGRVFMVGHQYLYNDYMQSLKHEIEKGTLGKIHYFFSEHFYYRHERADVGSFWDGATHELAIVDYLFGLGKIKTASGHALNVTGEGDRDDFAAANVEFGNGLFLNMVTSRLNPQKVRHMIFGGERGTATYDELEPKEKLKLFDLAQQPIAMAPVSAGEPLRNQVNHFLECIRNKKTPLTGIDHGLRVTEALEFIAKNIMKHDEY